MAMPDKSISNSERVYAFDALRAIMMLLGLVIHTALTYTVIDYGKDWPLKDPDNSLVFDVIIAWIHSFRMPVFFVAAGYFGALMFYKKGPNQMLLNRVRRILFPFLLGVLIFNPLVFFSFVYSTNAFSGVISSFEATVDAFAAENLLPVRVIHLWFLYFLMIFSIVFYLLAMIFNKKSTFTTLINKAFTYILQNWWLRLSCMTLVFFMCLRWMGTDFLLTNESWSIDPAIFTTYFLFFGTGWVLYSTKNLEHLIKYPVWQLSIGMLLFLIHALYPWPADIGLLIIKQALAAIYTSLFIFGFIAFFLTYFNSYSAPLSYIMDSAYWVYIVHFPVVLFIPGLMAGLTLPPILKFAITLSITSGVCFVTYKFLVRSTFIGMFLNGKVHKEKKINIANNIALES